MTDLMTDPELAQTILSAAADRRAERRRFIKLASGGVAVAGGLSLLAACGGGDSNPAPSPTPTPTPTPSASSIAAMDPPETAETVRSCPSIPSSFRRRSAPRWNSAARKPPPERHSAVPRRGPRQLGPWCASSRAAAICAPAGSGRWVSGTEASHHIGSVPRDGDGVPIRCGAPPPAAHHTGPGLSPAGIPRPWTTRRG